MNLNYIVRFGLFLSHLQRSITVVT